ncbi:MAG: L-type lectin-domain containing protein [Caldilineaceae bacterium]
MKLTLMLKVFLSCFILFAVMPNAKAGAEPSVVLFPPTVASIPSAIHNDAIQDTYDVAGSILFDYPNFDDSSGLQLLGDTKIIDTKLRITPATPDQVGAAWYATPLFVQDSFVTMFDFQISEPGGGTDPDGNPGADGFAFVIQNSSLSAIGGGGGFIGYSGIVNSIAVEFDTWNNGPFDHNGDPNGNHISVHTRGVEPNNSDHGYSWG